MRKWHLDSRQLFYSLSESLFPNIHTSDSPLCTFPCTCNPGEGLLLSLACLGQGMCPSVLCDSPQCRGVLPAVAHSPSTPPASPPHRLWWDAEDAARLEEGGRKDGASCRAESLPSGAHAAPPEGAGRPRLRLGAAHGREQPHTNMIVVQEKATALCS